MSTFIVRIDVDGRVTRCEGRDVLAVAEAGLHDQPAFTGRLPWGDEVHDRRSIDVCSTQPHEYAPLPTMHGTTVFVVHEFGRLLDPPLPVNVKGWAMYGRSPLVGPVWCCIDGCEEPLPDWWITAISMPHETWIQEQALGLMGDLARREGLTIPEGVK